MARGCELGVISLSDWVGMIEAKQNAADLSRKRASLRILAVVVFNYAITVVLVYTAHFFGVTSWSYASVALWFVFAACCVGLHAVWISYQPGLTRVEAINHGYIGMAIWCVVFFLVVLQLNEFRELSFGMAMLALIFVVRFASQLGALIITATACSLYWVGVWIGQHWLRQSEIHPKEFLWFVVFMYVGFVVAYLAQQSTNQRGVLRKARKDLKEAQAQLIQADKMSSLGQMVAGVAHELNNPLNFLQSNFALAVKHTQEIEETIFTVLPDNEKSKKLRGFLKENFDEIREASVKHEEGVARSAEIIDSLLRFSRNAPVERSNEALADVVAEACTILANPLKKVQFTSEVAPDLHLECNRTQLGQVFINIINNGIYAALSSKPDSAALWLRAKRVEEKILIEIGDNGPGIPESVLNKIFDPFVTTKPIGVGTGMGLAVCYKIIQDHAGEMTATNTEEGALFTIKL